MTTALVLLVLTGHAFVVSATHFHAGRQPAPACVDGAQVGHFEGTETAPPSGAHEQCLLCRLQRNFVSDLQHNPPALDAPPAEPLGRSRTPDAAARRAHLLAPSGRAPPPA
ncbi:MAG TPA: hypothetical protein VN228_10325 [Pyrinomonadaceae bacterium]|nr:hypothetical protein [Pyrinomonadaceae bacterium]